MLIKANSHNGDALVGSDNSRLPAGMGVPWIFFILASTPRVLCTPPTQIYTGNGLGSYVCSPPFTGTCTQRGSWGPMCTPQLIGIPAITGTLGEHMRKCIWGDILFYNVCLPEVMHYFAPKNELKDIWPHRLWPGWGPVMRDILKPMGPATQEESGEGAGHVASLALSTIQWGLLWSQKMLNNFRSNNKNSLRTRVLVGLYTYIFKIATPV